MSFWEDQLKILALTTLGQKQLERVLGYQDNKKKT